MIERAAAFEFVRAATNGRTGPLIMMCENQAGENVELFCKFSAGCEQGVIHLAREVIAVCLAADLGLPVPKPYIVDIPPDLAPIIADQSARSLITRSETVAFGSTIQRQFGAWKTGNAVSNALLPTAAATFVFDSIIQNPDRLVGNPNCLVKGEEVRLIDHDLAFSHLLVLAWRAPWVLGGLQNLKDPNHRHIFFDGLVKREIDFVQITSSWQALRDDRLQEYANAIPTAWAGAFADVNAAVRLICDARDNIEACIAEVRRVLA